MKKIWNAFKMKLKKMFKNQEVYQYSSWKYMEDHCLSNYGVGRLGAWYY